MRKIFLYLIISILILGVLTLFLEYKEKYREPFSISTTIPTTTTLENPKKISILDSKNNSYNAFQFNGSKPPSLNNNTSLSEYILSYNNKDKLEEFNIIDNYSISLLFKEDNPDYIQKNNIISINNQWKVYIENNTIYLAASNAKSSNNDNILKNQDTVSIKLNSLDVDKKKNLLGTQLEAKYYHLAISAKKLNSKKKEIKIFLNGLQRNILIDIITNENDLKFTDVNFGYDNANSNFFEGTMLDIKYFNYIPTSDKLCSMWQSCQDFECPFDVSGRTFSGTNPREDCKNACVESGCSDIACRNKCYNLERSIYRPQCNFKPQGITLNMCIDECQSNDNCIYTDCLTKCEDCSDKDKCQWIDKSPLHQLNPDSVDPNLLDCKKCAPPSLTFKVNINKELIIQFEHPFVIEEEHITKDNNHIDKINYKYYKNSKVDSKNNDVYFYDSEIDMFVFIIYKTYKRQKEGERILTYNVPPTFKDNLDKYNTNPALDHILTSDLKKWVPVHTKVISDLDSDEYTIICKSVRKRAGNCKSTDPNNQENTISDSSYRYSINMDLSSLKN